MDLQESLSLALINLTSPAVLAFVLGLVAVARYSGPGRP